MNGKNYNTESARSYLLGSLPEQETLRYDELSIVDDGFSDFLRNVENDLVDSYVNGSLDEAAAGKFESSYLTTPRRRQKVAFARAFFQHTDRDPTIEPTVLTVAEIGFWEKLRLALKPATLAFSAIALLCLVGAVWLIRNQREPQPADVAVTEPQNTATNVVTPQDRPVVAEVSPTETVAPPVNEPGPEKSHSDQPEPRKAPAPKTPHVPVIASFVLTPPLRGAGETKSLKLAQNVGRAGFRLELEPADYTVYKVELLDQTSKVVWNAGNVKAKGDQVRSISVNVPAAALKPQLYVFRVSGIAPDGSTENVGDYTFRIMR